MTEAINVELRMEFDESNDGFFYTGTWEFIGAGNEVLNDGTLTATVAGPFVSIVLDDGQGTTDLEGTLQNNGNRIAGDFSTNGSFFVDRQ